MNPEINLQKVLLPNDQTRIDLIINNVPKNFLGIAFDLNFENGKYDQFSMADNLQEGKTEPPIFLAQSGDKKVIFGFTSKASDLVQLEDGKIGSFLFDGQISNISLEKLIVSTFDGKREDLTNLKWQVTDGAAADPAALAYLKDGATVEVPPASPADSGGGAAAVLGVNTTLGNDLMSGELLQTNLTQQQIDSLLNGKPVSGSTGTEFWWYLAGAFILFLFLYMLNRKFKFIQRKTRIRLLGRTFE